MDVQDYVEVGKVVKTHGVGGELIAELDNPDILENSKEPIVLEIEGLRVPFFIEHAQAVSAQRARIMFDCTHTEQRAKTLVGCKLFLSPDALEQYGNSYTSPNAVVGFNVIDQKKGDIGRITSIENIDINPLMVIGDNNILIPFHPDIVVKIDFRKKQVITSAPEGLISIYQ